MVRMTDIMKDIKEEYNASKVAFASHFGTAGTEQGRTTDWDVREEPTTLESREQSAAPTNDVTVAFSMGCPEEEEESLIEHPSKGHTRPAKCRSCGDTAHLGLCVIPQRFARDETISFHLPYCCTSEQVGKLDFVWHCGECGDGPHGGWQVSCQACGHIKCGVYHS
jgi:hypothetical protein